MHKDLLTSKAPYFAAGLRAGTFQEALENKFEFPVVGSDVIAAFVSWLYKDTLNDIPVNAIDSFGVTIRLYQFADSINLAVLQNQCLDHVLNIESKTKMTPKGLSIAAHYDNSLPNDSMRKLLVDIIAGRLMNGKHLDVKASLKDGLLNHELVLDLLSRMNKVVTSNAKVSNPIRSVGWYHVQQTLAKS